MWTCDGTENKKKVYITYIQKQNCLTQLVLINL